MIRQIIKEQLLLEKKIALIRANLTINYDLRHDERSQHSEKRKWRHVASGGDKIHDLYIGGETNIDEIIIFWQEVKRELAEI